MSKSTVTFRSANLGNIQAEMLKQATQHFKGTDFPAKCPSCSKEIAISDGMNICPVCKSEIAFDLRVDKV